jgi:hypothetical protein
VGRVGKSGTATGFSLSFSVSPVSIIPSWLSILIYHLVYKHQTQWPQFRDIVSSRQHGHKQPPFPILTHTNPALTFPRYFPKIHFSMIHVCRGLSCGLIQPEFFTHIFYLTYVCYMPCPSHTPEFDHPNNT